MQASGGARMGPYLRYEWARLRLPGHEESGGMSAHAVEASATGTHAATLGWRVRHELDWDGRPLRLDADAGWRRVLGGHQVASTQRFRTPGGSSGDAVSAAFTSAGQPLARNALTLGLGVRAEPWRNVQVSARYSGMFGGAHRDHAGWLDARWAF